MDFRVRKQKTKNWSSHIEKGGEKNWSHGIKIRMITRTSIASGSLNKIRIVKAYFTGYIALQKHWVPSLLISYLPRISINIYNIWKSVIDLLYLLYLESLVHGGRQQQMTEMRHRTPLHCVDWALVASQVHQKPPWYPCSARLVIKIGFYSLRHFW